MGQKVNPNAIRIGIANPEADSVWFAETKDFPSNLNADINARKFLEKKLKDAGVSEVKIRRLAKTASITIAAARPGVIIGPKGKDVDNLRAELTKIMKVPVHLKIDEVRKPDLDAKLVAEGIARRIEGREMYRRAMKRAVSSALRAGAKGVRVVVSGRLGGAEIARDEKYKEGRVPLHTFRADIDYALAEAKTTYGIIGIKVWLYKGDVLTRDMGDKPQAAESAAA